MADRVKLKLGIVGMGGRPHGFIAAIGQAEQAELAAVCDLDAAAMDRATEGLEGVRKYTDYERMLDEAGLDAVVIATPMQLHAPQAAAALARNIHVFSEVTPAVSLEQCRELAAACKRSKATYMLGENCNYMKPYMVIREMIRAGAFGDVYYAEGEYLHSCRILGEATPWRRQWHSGVNGITYGTHSLGPILSWFEGDRVAKVSCLGSGRHYKDARGSPYEQEDTCVMLAKTVQGRLIKLRLDIISNRTYNLKYILQGTKAAYDSERTPEESGKIWRTTQDEATFFAHGEEPAGEWKDIAEYEAEYRPELWTRYGDGADGAGHGGSDYVMMRHYLDALLQGGPMPIGIHEAMDMTLPGLISQQSIARDGAWLEVPDSREW